MPNGLKGFEPQALRIAQPPAMVAPAAAEAAQQLSTLSGRLEQFSQTMFQRQAEITADKAKEAAFKDMYDGKPFHKEPVYTVYGKAYNDTLSATFGANAELAISRKSSELELMHPNDPVGYSEAMDSYVNGLAKNAPTEALRSAIGITGGKFKNAVFGKLSISEKKEHDASTVETLRQTWGENLGQIISKLADENTKDADILKEKSLAHLNTLVRDELISEADAKALIDDAEYEITAGVMEERIKRLRATGEEVEATTLIASEISRFREDMSLDQTKKYRARLSKLSGSSKSARKTSAKSSIDSLQKLIKDASARGENELATAYMNDLKTLTDTYVSQDILGTSEATWASQAALTSAQTQSFLRSGNEAIDAGMGHAYIMSLGDEKTKYGQAFKALPVEAQKEIMSMAKERTEAFEKARTGRMNADDDYFMANSKANLKNLKHDMAVFGKELSNSEIKNLEGKGFLTSTDAKELIDFKAEVTEEETKTYLSKPENLLAITEDQLMEAKGLSEEDKQALIKERSTLEESTMFKWTSSEDGREAIARIDRLFGIVKDSPFAKWETEDPRAREHDSMRTELYDRISALPLPERAGKALGIANELIRERKDIKAEEEVEKKAKSTREKLDLIQTKVDNYNKDTLIEWGIQDPKSVYEMIDETFQSTSTREELKSLYGAPTIKAKETKVPKRVTSKLPPLTIYAPKTEHFQGTRPTFTPTAGYLHPERGILPVVAQGTTNSYTGRTGGSKSWRNNNPFNITAMSGLKPHGAVGRAVSTTGDVGDQNMLVFKDYEAGQQAFIDLIYRMYDDAPIEQTFAKYQSEGFDNKLQGLRLVGVPTNIKFSELTTDQQIDFLKVWRRFEGYIPGGQA